MAANLTAKFQMIDDMSAKLDKIGQSGESMVDSLEAISDAADSAFGEVKSGSAKAAQSVDGVATAATSAAQQATQMGTDVADAAQKATEETEKLGEEVGFDVKLASGEANSLQSLGIAMMLQEIAEAFAECSEAAAQVETVSAKVSTIADTTQMSLAKINQSTVALSNDTGQAATALLDSVYNSISAGVQTANAVEFVDKANQLAVGGFTNATTAVDVLTTALNAYGLSVDNVSRISDYLVTTQNLGKCHPPGRCIRCADGQPLHRLCNYDRQRYGNR